MILICATKSFKTLFESLKVMDTSSLFDSYYLMSLFVSLLIFIGVWIGSFSEVCHIRQGIKLFHLQGLTSGTMGIMLGIVYTAFFKNNN